MVPQAPGLGTDTQDVLSLMLSSCRSERATTARFELAAPWALHSRGVEGLLMRICAGEPYWLDVPGAGTHAVAPGDIVLLPQGSAHTIASAPDLAAEPLGELVSRYMVGRHGDHPVVFEHGGAGPRTALFSLHLWMPARGPASLLASLPPVLVVRASEVETTARLALVTASLVDETLAQSPGWQLAAARMADLLLLHVLRRHVLGQGHRLPGWARAMTDPGLAPALAALHGQPEHGWTVADLAQRCHFSRSVFSERFKAAVGVSPMAYLLDVRMGAAADRLHAGGTGVAQVAAAAGYASEKAFARAFTRWAGVSPAAYSRRRTPGA